MLQVVAECGYQQGELLQRVEALQESGNRSQGVSGLDNVDDVCPVMVRIFKHVLPDAVNEEPKFEDWDVEVFVKVQLQKDLQNKHSQFIVGEAGCIKLHALKQDFASLNLFASQIPTRSPLAAQVDLMNVWKTNAAMEVGEHHRGVPTHILERHA
mmetsp:Transcript_85699/g.128395  ORF Transcript_85699/g.128395 Transcript_85699/m.128395 type:complete len:155 (-) Transcript_85699:147-611(-)|eukprot:3012168-Rhodomonas_salina.2